MSEIDIYHLFFFSIIAILTWVTLKGREAFPFSSYPMFSGLLELKSVVVYRILLESKDKKTKWWKSRFFRRTRFIGMELARISQLKTDDKISRAAVGLKKQQLLVDVVTQIKIETGTTENIAAISIVKRTPVRMNGEVSHKDELIERYPIESVK